ncbi:hypothetical protein LEMLEM_LOCUS6811, partial [Lemmus lemmus]
WWPRSRPPPPCPQPLPCAFPAAPRPVALLLRPALPGSPRSAGSAERRSPFSAASGEWLLPVACWGSG